MDSVPDVDQHIMKSTQVSVKQEIIDSEYNAAVGNCESTTEYKLLDNYNYNSLDNQEVDVCANNKDDMDKPKDKSECDTVTVIENIKWENETTDEENLSEKHMNFKEKDRMEESTEVLKTEITALQEEVKSEAMIKFEETRPNAIINVYMNDYKTEECQTVKEGAYMNDYKTEDGETIKEGTHMNDYKMGDNETVKEGAEMDLANNSENNVQPERSATLFCDITAPDDDVQNNTNFCKGEDSDASHETVHNTEKEHQSVLEKKGYMCKICKKTFIKKSSLSSHKITHTGETPFRCQVCNKGFNVRSNLNVHLRIHTGQRPHVCEICQKTFRQAGQLKTHERIHKGEKPYSCNQCSRSFRNSSALITHQRTHTGERPFPCDLCSRSFSTSTSLKTHRITHSGTMLYDCPVCGRQFNRKNNLNVHIKRHNKNRKFSCPKCSNGFVMRAHLLGHLKRAHKTDLQSQQIGMFLDSCEDNIVGVIVKKDEQEPEVKNEDEFESNNREKFSDDYNCSGTKDEIGGGEMEIKADIDGNKM